MKRSNGSQQEALADIRRFRARFDDAVKQAKAAGSPYSSDFVNSVMAGFDAVEAELGSASGSVIEQLVDHAESLSQLRAYVYPREEIALQGKSALADMSEWSVPPTVLQTLHNDVLPLLSGPDINAARAALYTLFDDYDYWNWYVDWYDAFMSRSAVRLLTLVVVLLAGALAFLSWGWVIPGLMCAGGSGALVSVVSKLPPLSVYGEAASYKLRIRSRLGAGLAASLIGSGMLASGIITIALPNNTSVNQMITACAIRPETGVKTALPDSPSASSGTTSGACTTASQLILLAVAMLLGFSERGLTSFEDRIFPASSRGAPPTTPPTGPAPGQGAAPATAPVTPSATSSPSSGGTPAGSTTVL